MLSALEDLIEGTALLYQEEPELAPGTVVRVKSGVFFIPVQGRHATWLIRLRGEKITSRVQAIIAEFPL